MFALSRLIFCVGGGVGPASWSIGYGAVPMALFCGLSFVVLVVLVLLLLVLVVFYQFLGVFFPRVGAKR